MADRIPVSTHLVLLWMLQALREGQGRNTVHTTVEGHGRQNPCKHTFGSVKDVTSSLRGHGRNTDHTTVEGHGRQNPCKYTFGSVTDVTSSLREV